MRVRLRSWIEYWRYINFITYLLTYTFIQFVCRPGLVHWLHVQALQPLTMKREQATGNESAENYNK